MSPQIILTLNLMEDSILLNEGVLDTQKQKQAPR